MGKKSKEGPYRLSSAFKAGAIALAFLIIGYQIALFVHQAAIVSIVSRREAEAGPAVGGGATDDSSGHQDGAAQESAKKPAPANKEETLTDRVEKAAVKKHASRTVESFRFNPNTADVITLMRLGFTEKQAQSIDNYRAKGGRFARKSDFAKSFVVSDSVYARLEPFIDIPLLDINAADSAAFDDLPGIGPYYAAKMVEYRTRLRGYSYPEQLMDIWKFDREKYEALSDLICVGSCEPYPLWTLPEDSLKLHPYILSYASHGIAIFRENTPKSEWTVERLSASGILKPDLASKLSRCRIADP